MGSGHAGHWSGEFDLGAATVNGHPLPPDLPLLFGGSPKVGLGLYNSISAIEATALEFGMFILGGAVYAIFAFKKRKAHMNFDGVFVPVKQPRAWISLFTNWPIVADDDCEVCHRFASFPLSYLRYRPNNAYLVPSPLTTPFSRRML